MFAGKLNTHWDSTASDHAQDLHTCQVRARWTAIKTGESFLLLKYMTQDEQLEDKAL
jgi:hypothetical protein